MKRFWNKVKKTKTCWLWKACITTHGYGLFGWGGAGKAISAHRASWILHRGPIPNKMHVLHKCDIRNCVNPDHLFLGTNKDNMADMMRKGRKNARKGSAHGYAKLTENDVLQIRDVYPSVSSRELAKRYGVVKSTILFVIHRKTWAHV